MLGVLDRDKVNGVPNMELLLVITVTIMNHMVPEFLRDKRSSCKSLKAYTLEQLELCQLDPSLGGGGELFASNVSITRPCEMRDITISLEEESERRMEV